MKKEDIKYPINNVFDETYTEILEWKEYERFFEVQNGDIIIDIGANIGLFSLSVEHKYSKCYVIEPDPNNFTCLKENLSNSIDKTIFINEGISNKNTMSVMTDNSGNGMIVGKNLIVPENTISSIVNRSFRNFMENFKIDHVDFLKIDCEGCEYFVFVEDNIDLLEKINSITGEIHIADEFIVGPDNTQISKEYVIKTLDLLEENFDIIYTSIDGVIIPNVRDRLDYYDQFLIYGTNKNIKNKLIVEYLDGYVKVESEKFDVDNPQLLNFLNTKTDTNIYSAEITNTGQWSKTSIKTEECKVILGDYSVTVSEEFPKKIIAY